MCTEQNLTGAAAAREEEEEEEEETGEQKHKNWTSASLLSIVVNIASTASVLSI